MVAEDTLRLRVRWLSRDPDAEESRRDGTLRLLRQQCRKGYPARPVEFDLRGIDLAGEDLRELDFSRFDLAQANLSGTDLRGANLSFARMPGALLAKARLGGAEFLGADLTGACLNECSADAAGFGAADLSGASLLSADLTGASLSKANLSNADLRAARLDEARLVEAELSAAQLTRASMRGCDLKYCRLARASFHNADLREARLLGISGYKQANWVGADIRAMDLRGAYLVRRHIQDENYLYEFRTRSRLHGVLYWAWWLTSACGRSLARWAAMLLVVTGVFAFLYTIVEVDYGEAQGPFSPIYFSVVTLTTLGYGDIRPVSTTAQVLTTLQALLGYIGLGGLLAILANKMARRAE